MAHLFTVNGANATALSRASLTEHGLYEVQHLERWVVQNPEVLGDSVMIVATQFDKWASIAGDQAADRLDILGLDSNGQLVVVELKRDSDRRVHLQAITYAALVASFSKESLGRLHAQYASASGPSAMSADEGLQRLADHVDGDWDPDILAQPRIVLIAERFPLQVITTAKWLTTISGGTLTIECHEVSLFELPADSPLLCASFTKIWPVDDMQDRVLGPRLDEVKNTQKKIADKTRRARTAKVIADEKLVPSGASVTLSLSTWVSPTVVTTVETWLDEDPIRRDITWHNDPWKPLLSAYDPNQAWSLSRLAKRIIALATNGSEPATIAGGDVWRYQDKSLASIAGDFLDSELATTADL